MSHHQNAEHNHNIKVANKPFEQVAGFKYLRTVTNLNCILKEIKLRAE
jgi:hypothetical protein